MMAKGTKTIPRTGRSTEVGLAAPILAMAERDDVAVVEGKGSVSLGMVETGESGAPPTYQEAPPQP